MASDTVQSMKPTCKTCRFWHPLKAAGRCKRHAPRPYAAEGRAVSASATGLFVKPIEAEWRITAPTEPACGDYEPNDLERSRLAYERMKKTLAAYEKAVALPPPPNEPWA